MGPTRNNKTKNTDKMFCLFQQPLAPKIHIILVDSK